MPTMYTHLTQKKRRQAFLLSLRHLPSLSLYKTKHNAGRLGKTSIQAL